jgi:hypothetical protein
MRNYSAITAGNIRYCGNLIHSQPPIIHRTGFTVSLFNIYLS